MKKYSVLLKDHDQELTIEADCFKETSFLAVNGVEFYNTDDKGTIFVGFVAFTDLVSFQIISEN